MREPRKSGLYFQLLLRSSASVVTWLTYLDITHGGIFYRRLEKVQWGLRYEIIR
jgi:hypothetical protein